MSSDSLMGGLAGFCTSSNGGTTAQSLNTIAQVTGTLLPSPNRTCLSMALLFRERSSTQQDQTELCSHLCYVPGKKQSQFERLGKLEH